MSDIFISYSRKDSQQALTLAEKLRIAGMDVWIDQHGLELASSWSRDIVDAIEQCKAFVLLLSETALASKNVVKELSLASESGRSIIPIEIQHVRLTSEFKYALAGIQRAPISDLDAIFRSLEKLGLNPQVAASTKAPRPAGRGVGGEVETRKTLLVLPFVDLSQSKDNEWFADGLTEELIDTLSNIKSLRIIDRRTAMGFKFFEGTPRDIARDLDIRYFIEGSVRRAGDTVKITAQVLDVEGGDYLSALSHKGTMDDIFEMQEDVARKIAAALELRLTGEESAKLSTRGTTNAEAFELYLAAKGQYQRQSKESITAAITMMDTALEWDENFLDATLLRAHCLLDYYRLYGPGIGTMESIEATLKSVIQKKPESADAYAHLAFCYQLQGRFEEGEREAKRSIECAPESSAGVDALAFLYVSWERYELAAQTYEASLPLHTLTYRIYFNLYFIYSRLENADGVKSAAMRAIPEFERWLRLHPDDVNERVSYCVMLFGAGREQEARAAAGILRSNAMANGKAFYNLGCFYLELREKEAAFECLRKGIAAGFRNLDLFRQWKDNDLFKDDAEFDELIAKLPGA